MLPGNYMASQTRLFTGTFSRHPGEYTFHAVIHPRKYLKMLFRE